MTDLAFAGRADEVKTQYARLRSEGTLPGVIAGSALRQVMQTPHRVKLAMEVGESLDQAINSFRPALHFKRKRAVETALQNWSSARLEKSIAQFADVALDLSPAAHAG